MGLWCLIDMKWKNWEEFDDRRRLGGGLFFFGRIG